ncbi:RHTO0S01e00584g1_1 [Rhodotorula toruloides]|uniref:RHTO0S01e00584g1_1 n=1 Tax=Rhodotorula toruloides TaxID=5286 RepID=A0A061AJM7_RHOTO|nr:RHTO0S01e00584g1_1 [Rhodotorula toruloides]
MEVLVREMEEKGLPRLLPRWTESSMSNRTCTLRLEGVSSEPVEWRSGLPQGSPLSPILFLLYNSGALAACKTTTSTLFGWVDDLNVLAWGRNVEEAVSAAQRIVPGLEEWLATHQSLFEPSKTFVTRFLPAQDRSADDPKVVLCGKELEYSSALGMLGVTIDERLTFKQHVASCAAKASKVMVGVGLLAKSRGGLKAKYVTPHSPPSRSKQTSSRSICASPTKSCDSPSASPRARQTRPYMHDSASPDLRCPPNTRRQSTSRFTRSQRSSSPAPELNRLPTHLSRRGRARRAAGSLLTCRRRRRSSPTLERFARSTTRAGWRPIRTARCLRVELVRWQSYDSAQERKGCGGRRQGRWVSTSRCTQRSSRAPAWHSTASSSPSAAPLTTLFINNQSVVRSPFNTFPTTGQSARLALRALALVLKHNHPYARLTLQWLAGHLAVPGNEMADEEAKRAAGVGNDKVGKSKGGRADGRGRRRRGPKLLKPDQSSSSSLSADESGWEEDEEERATRLQREVARLGRLDLSTLAGPDELVKGGTMLPKLLSSLKQAHRTTLLAEWTRQWTLSSLPGAGLRTVDARPPGPPFVRALHSLDRVHSTILARLRLDFNDLGSSKARMGLGTGLCECGKAVDTRQHYILECSLYSDKRQQLRREIGLSNLKMDKIFSPRFFRPLLRGPKSTWVFPGLNDSKLGMYPILSYPLSYPLHVAKAFPSVRTEVLVREMEEKGLPRLLRRWTESFMSDRTCTLRLEGVSSEPVDWRSGLPQGSPLSPILFLLYNAGALEACETPTSTAFGWVDDLNDLAWGRYIQEAVSAAQQIVPGLEEWSATCHSLFELSKTLVMCFSPARERSHDNPKIVLCGKELEYLSALGMLGVTLDE